VKVTERRAAEDFAACMRDLSDVHYPGAERIRAVLDNLSTHSVGALCQTFPANEARRVLRRLEFHYVPKHASWLNMVEIEIGVLASQCLDRRIESFTRLVAETAASSKQGMKAGASRAEPTGNLHWKSPSIRDPPDLDLRCCLSPCLPRQGKCPALGAEPRG
jgi:DDE superfamily endonuclease